MFNGKTHYFYGHKLNSSFDKLPQGSCDSIDRETDSAMHVHLDLLLYHISVQLAAVKTRGVCVPGVKRCALSVLPC